MKWKQLAYIFLVIVLTLGIASEGIGTLTNLFTVKTSNEIHFTMDGVETSRIYRHNDGRDGMNSTRLELSNLHRNISHHIIVEF
jgi:arginine decarboxylase-like protein